MNKLRRRTLRSFVVFFALALLAIGAWTWARRQPEVDGVPKPFRAVLELNGRIWHKLFDPQRLAAVSPPPVGKKPRFNGDLGLGSEIDLARWKMELFSGDPESSRRIEVSMPELRALPRTETATEFKCIEGWSDVVSYAGVRFSDFLSYYKVGTRPDGGRYRYVALETPDSEYYVSIDMESMLHPQTVLAYEMNGQPISPGNGAPLRLIIPVKYGIKSLKRIGKIYFSDTRPPDYWAERGYDWFAGL